MLKTASTALTIALLALPLLSGARLVIKKKRSFVQWFASFLAISIACYILLMISVWLTEVHLDRELAKFDLNGDGVFSGSEITPEMKEAMRKVTNDTGRTFAPFTGLITCPLYSGFWHALIGLPYLIFQHIKQNKQGEQADADNRDPAGA